MSDQPIRRAYDTKGSVLHEMGWQRGTHRWALSERLGRTRLAQSSMTQIVGEPYLGLTKPVRHRPWGEGVALFSPGLGNSKSNKFRPHELGGFEYLLAAYTLHAPQLKSFVQEIWLLPFLRRGRSLTSQNTTRASPRSRQSCDCQGQASQPGRGPTNFHDRSEPYHPMPLATALAPHGFRTLGEKGGSPALQDKRVAL